MSVKTGLFIGLGIVLAVWAWAIVTGIQVARRHRASGTTVTGEDPMAPTGAQGVIGFVTAFFDTLGIGSFATTTAVFKLRGMVPVKLIPGTLNVGHTLDTIAQAFIYTTLVPVEPMTLVLMIAAAVAGSWLGAGLVVSWSRYRVQMGMGIALCGAALLLLGTQLHLLPMGGDALGLSGAKLGIGLAGNFLLGALMMLGVGLYAPCMILIYLLGMNPLASFPIMMGSCAFLMPASSVRFVKARSYHLQASLGIALGSVPGVLIAAYLVKSLPLKYLNWLVLVVVVYTAANMLLTARQQES